MYDTGLQLTIVAASVAAIVAIVSGVVAIRSARRDKQGKLPKPPHRQLSIEQLAVLVGHARRIAEICDLYTNAPANTDMVDRATRKFLDPKVHQTANGLFLKVVNGKPNTLWTPFGEWLLTSVRLDKFNGDALMNHLTLRNQSGADGIEVYAILAIDGEELPIPQIQTNRRWYVEYLPALYWWYKLYTAAGSDEEAGINV